MGSGKSVVGALVAQRTQAPFHDLDRMIELEAGIPIPEIFANGGEAAFRALESEVLPNALEPGSVVALGGGSLMNDTNWHLVAATSSTVYLEVPFDTMWERIRKLSGRPLASGRSRDEVRALFELRLPRYEQALHRVDGDRPPAAVADEVIKLWSA
ncbi:MAG TPA: shikimate kinase [Candidatus Dormibacteraeota bacterium]|jgi:shikimate kinase|nr:shikimate kinase [Candidatus Dormibacteraeota bacterium]